MGHLKRSNQPRLITYYGNNVSKSFRASFQGLLLLILASFIQAQSSSRPSDSVNETTSIDEADCISLSESRFCGIGWGDNYVLRNLGGILSDDDSSFNNLSDVEAFDTNIFDKFILRIGSQLLEPGVACSDEPRYPTWLTTYYCNMIVQASINACGSLSESPPKRMCQNSCLTFFSSLEGLLADQESCNTAETALSSVNQMRAECSSDDADANFDPGEDPDTCVRGTDNENLCGMDEFPEACQLACDTVKTACPLAGLAFGSDLPSDTAIPPHYHQNDENGDGIPDHEQLDQNPGAAVGSQQTFIIIFGLVLVLVVLASLSIALYIFRGKNRVNRRKQQMTIATSRGAKKPPGSAGNGRGGARLGANGGNAGGGGRYQSGTSATSRNIGSYGTNRTGLKDGVPTKSSQQQHSGRWATTQVQSPHAALHSDHSDADLDLAMMDEMEIATEALAETGATGSTLTTSTYEGMSAQYSSGIMSVSSAAVGGATERRTHRHHHHHGEIKICSNCNRKKRTRGNTHTTTTTHTHTTTSGAVLKTVKSKASQEGLQDNVISTAKMLPLAPSSKQQPRSGVASPASSTRGKSPRFRVELDVDIAADLESDLSEMERSRQTRPSKTRDSRSSAESDVSMPSTVASPVEDSRPRRPVPDHTVSSRSTSQATTTSTVSSRTRTKKAPPEVIKHQLSDPTVGVANIQPLSHPSSAVHQLGMVLQEDPPTEHLRHVHRNPPHAPKHVLRPTLISPQSIPDVPANRNVSPFAPVTWHRDSPNAMDNSAQTPPSLPSYTETGSPLTHGIYNSRCGQLYPLAPLSPHSESYSPGNADQGSKSPQHDQRYYDISPPTIYQASEPQPPSPSNGPGGLQTQHDINARIDVDHSSPPLEHETPQGAMSPPQSETASGVGPGSAQAKLSHLLMHANGTMSTSGFSDALSSSVMRNPADDLPPAAPQGPIGRPAGSRYRVLYNYTPQMPDEIMLCRGDIVSAEKEFADGWARGTNLATGQIGFFPMGKHLGKLDSEDELVEGDSDESHDLMTQAHERQAEELQVL